MTKCKCENTYKPFDFKMLSSLFGLRQQIHLKEKSARLKADATCLEEIRHNLLSLQVLHCLRDAQQLSSEPQFILQIFRYVCKSHFRNFVILKSAVRICIRQYSTSVCHRSFTRSYNPSNSKVSRHQDMPKLPLSCAYLQSSG